MSEDCSSKLKVLERIINNMPLEDQRPFLEWQAQNPTGNEEVAALAQEYLSLIDSRATLAEPLGRPDNIPFVPSPLLDQMHRRLIQDFRNAGLTVVEGAQLLPEDVLEARFIPRRNSTDPNHD